MKTTEFDWCLKHGVQPSQHDKAKYTNPLHGRALKASQQPRDKRGRFVVDTRDALDFSVEALR